MLNVHHWRWGFQAWRSWNAEELLRWIHLMHCLRTKQLVKPLSDHNCRNSLVTVSHLRLVLPLVLPMLTLVLTLVLALVLALVLTLVLLTAVVLILMGLTLMRLTLELTLVLLRLMLSTLHWTCIAMLCHHAANFRCNVLQIATKANIKQLLVESTAWLETSLGHLAQPTPHSRQIINHDVCFDDSTVCPTCISVMAHV